MPITKTDEGFKIENTPGVSKTHETAVDRLRAIKASQAKGKKQSKTPDKAVIVIKKIKLSSPDKNTDHNSDHVTSHNTKNNTGHNDREKFITSMVKSGKKGRRKVKLNTIANGDSSHA